jgi:hypothetical protein
LYDNRDQPESGSGFPPTSDVIAMAETIRIKPDPEGGSPVAEDELFEDAGDLEFYDNTLPDDPLGNMYIARLPEYVWKAWADVDDDAEIQIGTIRQWNEPDENGLLVVSYESRRLSLPELLTDQASAFSQNSRYYSSQIFLSTRESRKSTI